MEDGHSLSNYIIQESALCIVLRLRGGMQIFETITLEVESSYTIDNIMNKATDNER